MSNIFSDELFRVQTEFGAVQARFPLVFTRLLLSLFVRVFLLFLDGKESFFSRKTNTFSKSFSLSKNTGFFSGLDASKWWKGCLILQPFKFYHHQHVCYKPATHAFKKPCLSLLRIKSYLFSWWS